tara:strand:+ start:323 stop:901 length:579 start_codon:yes stop_codon:yes gene_type:complete
VSEKLLRTFLCIPVPSEVKSKKNMLFSTLQHSSSKINWVKNENLHLTVKFIGYTRESYIPKIINKVNNVTSNYEPFSLSVKGTGCFPKKERPRTLFMGIEGKINLLNNLVKTIEVQLEKLDFPKDRSNYIPHITIARVNYPQSQTPDVNLFLKSSYDPIDLSIDRVQFFSSELLPSGAIYSLVKTFPLGESI